MSTILKTADLLEEKIKTLLERYAFLKEENELLLKNLTQLKRQFSENQECLLKQQEEFKLLKIAKTIAGNKEDTRDTKLKINTLVREIDKCIVQLSE